MSTLAEQVVDQLKTDMDNVYDAGYQKGLKEVGGLDVSKFGIQNEVTGTNIVTCDYVNENEHNVEVKLSSDTVTDFSGVEVKIVGKNVVNFEKPCDISGRYYSWLVPKQENGFFTVSLIDKENGYDTTGLYLGLTVNGIDHANGVVWLLENGVVKKTEYCTKQDAAKSFRYISTYGDDKADVIKKIMNRFYIQVEIGEYTTNYEPYTEKTYTANADGTIDGVTSISPVMNIICEGVDISAKYYCVPSVEWHRLWDNLQEFGNRKDYASAFRLWNDMIFKPKYTILPIQADYMFFGYKGKSIIDIDYSQCQNMNYAFHNSNIEYLGIIDLSKCNPVGVFHTARYLHTIDKLIIGTHTPSTNTFQSATALENIGIEGTITNNFSVQWSPLLSDASVQNIIDCLADLTGQASQTITFHTDVKAKLTEEQIATITSKNWTLA